MQVFNPCAVADLDTGNTGYRVGLVCLYWLWQTRMMNADIFTGYLALITCYGLLIDRTIMRSTQRSGRYRSSFDNVAPRPSS